MRWIRACWNWAISMQRRIAETILRPDAITLAYRPAGLPDGSNPPAQDRQN